MKIIIDARLYGPKHTGNGRYTKNLIDGLGQIDSKNKYCILLRKSEFSKVKLPANFRKLIVDISHYSFSEQFFLPFVLSKISADVVHFTHFNVPVLYFGKFIVTIHDLIMHQYFGSQTSTLAWPLYLIKRLGYRIVFASAIYRSEAIIVPSKFVKRQILKNYRIKSEKIKVIYE